MSDTVPRPRLRRIAVVGTTGSGKTTLARQLARQLQIPHVELDALYWDANWTPAPVELFRRRAQEALRGKRWVTDGNYSKVRDLVWGRADTVVWLDYSLPVILARLTRRTLQRLVTREELWNENRENLRGAFLSRDSLLRWALQTHRRWRREYPILLGLAENAHLAVVRLRSPRTAREWLNGLQASALPFLIPSGQSIS